MGSQDSLSDSTACCCSSWNLFHFGCRCQKKKPTELYVLNINDHYLLSDDLDNHYVLEKLRNVVTEWIAYKCDANCADYICKYKTIPSDIEKYDIDYVCDGSFNKGRFSSYRYAWEALQALKVVLGIYP